MRDFYVSRAVNKAAKSALKASGLTKEEFAYRVLPGFLLDIIQKYLRVTVTGLSHIPKKGPCIVIANHSGFMGFDAMMLGHQIFQNRKRLPHIIAHKLWFLRPEIAVHAKKMGMIPATYENGLKILQKGELLLLFPEGEEGNFKKTSERYRLRRFRRGFMRLALATGAPIIPAAVIGAEETHITLSQIRWAKEILGIIVPVPLNVLPLPAKWRIKFGKPIKIEKNADLAADIDHVTKESKKIRTALQKQMHDELKKRKTIYL